MIFKNFQTFGDFDGCDDDVLSKHVFFVCERVFKGFGSEFKIEFFLEFPMAL